MKVILVALTIAVLCSCGDANYVEQANAQTKQLGSRPIVTGPLVHYSSARR